MSHKIASYGADTQPKLFSQILAFCLPLVAANLLQVAFNMADTVIVGLSSEADAVGAVGTTTAFINLILNVFIGCSVGAKVVMACAVGADDKKAIHETMHTALGMSVILGVLCGAIGWGLCPRVLASMGNTGRLYTLALTYTRLYFLGVPFVSIVNFASSLFHAAGNTKTPMAVLTFGGVLNVLLNLLFVVGFHRSVDGVAAATVLSNAVCAVLLIGCLQRDERFCLKIREVRLRKVPFAKILHIGLPAGLQSMLFSASHMLIQSSVLTVNQMLVPSDADFAPVVKGVAASTGLEGFANIAVSSVGQAAICFVGQSVGAGDRKRIGSVRRCCYGIGVGAAVLFGGLLLLAREPLFALYGVVRASSGSLERIAFDAAQTRTFIMLAPYALLALMEVGSGTLQGLGKAVTAASLSLIGSCAFRVVWLCAVFPKQPTLACIFVSFPISWLLTAALHFIFAEIALKSHKHVPKSTNGEKVH